MLMAADRRCIDRTGTWILAEIVPVYVVHENMEHGRRNVKVRNKVEIQSIRNTAEVSSLGNKGADWLRRRVWGQRRLAHLHEGAIRSSGTQTY